MTKDLQLQDQFQKGLPNTGKRPKVFGVGLHRTGTTSLRAALYHLGYDVVPPWRWTGRYGMNLKHEEVLKDAMDLTQKYDGCVYLPFMTFYKELYEAYPDAKFILTERDEDKWADSLTSFFGRSNWPEIRFVFGMNADPNYKDKLKKDMQEHNRAVKEFFSDKPGSLMVMNIGKGDRWPELCEFLGAEEPKMPFPRVNGRGSLYAMVVANAIPILSNMRSYFTGEKARLPKQNCRNSL